MGFTRLETGVTVIGVQLKVIVPYQDQTLDQGNLLRGSAFKFVYTCSLLSNTQFIRKQNGSKLKFLS